LIYRGMLQGYQWLFPILPQLPWTVTAFVGTLAPALGLVLLQATRGSTRAAARRDQIGPWPFLGMAAVALLWFNVGLFGVRPTLISGSSMDPALQTGDVAVVREVPPAEVQVGDIVRFRHEGVHVIHRVVEVQQAPEGPVFITQGDANNRLDPPVPAERIEGKVVFVIRKVGWIAIGLRQVVQWDR
jgi:signal peptidase